MSYSPDQFAAALLSRMTAHSPVENGDHSSSHAETEARYRNIADNIPGLVFQRALNLDGSISFPFVNDGAWQIAGIDPAEMRRNPALISDRIHPDDLPTLHAAVLQSFTDLKAHTNEFRYNHPTRGWRWLHTIARPRRRTDGTIVAETIAFDITDRKDTERELEENRQRLNDHLIELQDTKERLEQRTNELIRTVSDLAEARDASDIANRAKSDFLATMSHEIRTPMNGVLGMASLLKQTALDPGQQEFVDTIEQSGEALLCIINDVLDYSKMEAGQLDLDPTTFSVLEIIDNAVQLIRPKCEENGLALQSFVDPAIPDLVIGDAGRLRQILLNLLSNAAKFTKDGLVKIECLGPKTVGRDLEFQFAITDTGIGVSEEAQQHLFEVFSQADASTTRRFGGTGLGLSICRRLCNLMGGEISVNSTVGQGSTFSFNVSLKAAEGVPAETPTRRDDRTAILSTAADSGLDRQLRAYGIQTEIIEDDRVLFDRLDASATCDTLIVLDADSVSTSPALRSKLTDIGKAGIQPIWLVGHVPPEIQELGTAIDLPLRQPRIRKHIHRFLAGNVGATATPADIPSASALGPKTPTTTGSPVLNVLLVEDNKVNQRVAIAMLEAAGIAVSLAENGQVALDMLSTGRNFDIILMDIHMPEMDGITAATKIREMPAPLSSIPIIALTANAMKGDREKYLDAGMNDYVSKPIDPVALSEAIERQSDILTTLGSQKRRRLPAAPPPAITESDIEILFAGIDDIVK